MRVPSHHRRENAGADQMMTPMIDVVFLLLIFFVCASVGQIRESLLPTDLAAGALDSPQVTERPPPPLGEVWLLVQRDDAGRTVVQVNRAGEFYRDYAGLRRTLLALAEAAPEIPVILDIAPDIPLGDVVRVYDICREADFDSISFATRDVKG